MPTINKQQARPRPTTPFRTPTSRSDSILATAVSASDLDDDHVKMLLYGGNRVGKTTLACQFPKPLLLVGMEPSKTGGARSIKKVPGVKCLRVNTGEKVLKLALELAGGGHPYKTVVLDSATSLQDVILKDILGYLPEQLNRGEVTRDQYRVRAEKTKEALRPYLDLECHVVVIAKEKDHNPPDDNKPKILKRMQSESFIAAELGGSTVSWVQDACDYIGRLTAEQKIVTEPRTVTVAGKTITREVEVDRITVRRLQTLLHPNIAAGFRSCDPDKVPEYIEEPTFDKIMAVINGE